MTGGGLMQLVSYGAQDIYLTGKPSITFFKTTYRKHTNFSVETGKSNNYSNNYNPNDFADPTDNPVHINKNFTKELMAAGLYDQIYADNKIKVINTSFDRETCDLCMEAPQSVRTCCGHKCCHSCFTLVHVQKKSTCSFCRQDIGNVIFVSDSKLPNESKCENINNNSDGNDDTDDDSDDDTHIRNMKRMEYYKYLNNQYEDEDEDEDEDEYDDEEFAETNEYNSDSDLVDF